MPVTRSASRTKVVNRAPRKRGSGNDLITRLNEAIAVLIGENRKLRRQVAKLLERPAKKPVKKPVKKPATKAQRRARTARPTKRAPARATRGKSRQAAVQVRKRMPVAKTRKARRKTA